MLVPEEPLFRSIEQRDEAVVAELLDVAFEGDWPAFPIPVPVLDHLRWRLGSPGVVPGATTVLELDGRIVAYDGSIGRDVWVQGSPRAGCIMVDSAVHPDFQGRGLSKLHLRHFLARWADVEQPVSLEEGSNNPRLNQSSGLGSERMRVANTVEVLSRPLSPSAIARRAFARPSTASLARAARSLLTPRRGSAPTADALVRTVDEFDERADTLWEHGRTAFDYCVVRDARYLNWRYRDPRAGSFRVRTVEQAEELVGYSVLSAPGRAVRVIDLFVADGAHSALKALIEDAVSTARLEKASEVSILLPHVHPYRETLERFGFMPSMTVPNMGHRPRNDSLLDFLSTDPGARLHVAFGDSDHV